jgi:cyclic pyranopterin phosphate synthase
MADETKEPAVSQLGHLDEQGRAHMVDVGAKADSERLAVARGRITMRLETLALIQAGAVRKGDVLTVARVAGLQAAKRTHELIPICHPLLLTHMAVELAPGEDGSQAWIDVEATVRTTGQTGVEMEALTAVSAAALTVYDMRNAVDRDMCITDVQLVHKRGGKSGTWDRNEE